MNLDKVISEVDERFLSIALDTSLVINHWKSVDFRYFTIHCFTIESSLQYNKILYTMALLLANGKAENNTMQLRTLKYNTDDFCMIITIN